MKKTFMMAIMFILPALISAGPVSRGNVVVSYDSLVEALSGYHEIPGADYWARLEPESTKANLTRMADDPAVFTLVRARALRALVYYADDQVAQLLTRKATQDPLAYMRSSACEAYMLMDKTKATPLLSTALDDKDVMVRLTAARALRMVGTPEAKMALERRLGSEKNNTARFVINRSLELMER